MTDRPRSVRVLVVEGQPLLRDLLARLIDQQPGMRAVALCDSARAAIEGYLRSAADRFTAPGRPAGCMISTASLNCAAENQAARAAAAALRAQAFDLLVAKLEWAKSTGELPASADPHALARFYSAIVQGMSVQAIDGAPAAALHNLVDLALAAWPGASRG